MGKSKVLVVDDDQDILNQLKWGLSGEHIVFTAATAEDGLRVVREKKPDLVALDLALGSEASKKTEGLEVLEKILSFSPDTKVIMVTGDGEKENALKAIKIGAFDYYVKPVDLEELRIVIRRALQIRELELENRSLQERIETEKRSGEILGDSPEMLRVYNTIKRVAPVDVTVLITGESGTGKELIARAIHKQSDRRAKRFVSIDCGAIPENLLESELFGHEKGSFTSAYASRAGKLEIADGGTVFLDEIGELSLALQVKLLRFLQEREIERVGGRKAIKLDVRVIAATNRELKAAIASGEFREDLYFRLSVVSIDVPPLRNRGDDVLLMANYFLREYGIELKRPDLSFSKQSVRALRSYSWPGNVRELQNKVRRAIIMGRGKLIQPEDLDLVPVGESMTDWNQKTLKEVRDSAEKQALIASLRRSMGNISKAAKDIGVSRPTFHDLLKKHGVNASDFKEAQKLE